MMTKLFMLCFFMCTLISCQEKNTNESSPQDDQVRAEHFISSEAHHFDVDVRFINFERHEEDKVFKAVEIIKKVIKSEEFRQKVLNFSFRGRNEFYMNRGLSNEEIYQTLLKGSEELIPEIDHEMDLELELFYSRRSTVGYTIPGEMKIYMNRRFFYTYTPVQVAGNLFHEWTHKLGFTHSSRYTYDRNFTVPYALGELIESLGKKYDSI